MDKKLDTCFSLQRTIGEFIDDLQQVFTDENERSDFVAISVFYRRLHPETLMHKIHQHIVPHKAYIEKRDSQFFKENIYVFNQLPPEKVKYYQQAIFEKNRIAKEDIEMIWEYLDTIVALAELYK